MTTKLSPTMIESLLFHAHEEQHGDDPMSANHFARGNTNTLAALVSCSLLTPGYRHELTHLSREIVAELSGEFAAWWDKVKARTAKCANRWHKVCDANEGELCPECPSEQDAPTRVDQLEDFPRTTNEITVPQVQPQPGDKAVHVGDTIEVTDTFTGIVYQVDDDGWVRYHDVDDETQQHAASLKSATIRVLERADNPSHDPVGTIATVHNHLWIKHSINEWHNALMPNELRTNDAMRGRKVTGTVPGTPAARVQAGYARAALQSAEWTRDN